LLGPEQIRELEPHAAGLARIRAPKEGIVDDTAVVDAMVSKIRENGGEIRFSSEVIGLRNQGGWSNHTNSEDYEADF
jgi:L-2-hydroxyglutarate oxidase